MAAATPVITCPECDKKFKSKAEVAGKKIRCPFCTKVFIAPAADEDEALRTAIQTKDKPAEQQTKASADDAPEPVLSEEDEWSGNPNPYGVTHLDETLRCPNCAKEMESATATVCLHCGYNTMTREWGKTEKTVAVSSGGQFAHMIPGFLALFFLFTCLLWQLLFSLQWPYVVAGSTWFGWTDHESLRFWQCIFALLFSWWMGLIAYRRFVQQPTPPEAKMD